MKQRLENQLLSTKTYYGELLVPWLQHHNGNYLIPPGP